MTVLAREVYIFLVKRIRDSEAVAVFMAQSTLLRYCRARSDNLLTLFMGRLRRPNCGKLFDKCMEPKEQIQMS